MTETPPPDVREPLVRAPRVVLVCIAILVAIYVAGEFLPPASYDALIENFGFVPARIQEVVDHFTFEGAIGAALTFLTYALLHGGFMHLALNGLAFLIFGTVVARRVGAARFLAFSLVTSLAAILAHLAAHWGEAVPVIGASGAISGYMGGATRFMFYDPKHPPTGPGHLLPLPSRPVATFSLIFVLINAGVGLTGFSPDGSQDLTAWEAHIGGFFAGLFLLPWFDRGRNWLY
ncbi:MAG: rhomboid family intramembrane serine protease [Alphaproteobacteria bacterium]|nr:rhomboid family intramembrane serine protease [Alphaproteobacteria bacterium]